MAIYCGLNQINGYVRPYNWIAARIVSFFYNIVFVLVIVASAMLLVFGNLLMGIVYRIPSPFGKPRISRFDAGN